MSQRDRAIERLLRESAGKWPHEPASAACLDAETLAAWVDGALDPPSRRAAEAHAADCARCQESVAALARTMPVAETRSRLAWLWSKPWLVPATAAGAAVAVWLLVPTRAPEAPFKDGQIVAVTGGGNQERQPVPTEEARGPAREEPAALEPPASTVVDRSERAAPAQTEEARRRAANERPTEVAGRLDETAKVSADSIAAAEQAGRRAELPASAPAETLAAAPAVADARQPVAAEAQRAMVGQLAASLDVRSPDPAVRWRVGTTGAVEYTRDAGVTWERRPTGVDALLRAGAAPSPEVCWFVGLRGTVVVNAGAGWRALSFPEIVDLVAIQAVDASTASVTTADGRVFRTTTSGATWSASP